MDLTKYFDTMRRRENFSCREFGASDQEISNLENNLNIELPEDYVAFLKTFGFAWWFGWIIYGISENERRDALFQTLKARNEKLPLDFKRIPLEGIVISKYEGGGYYFLYSKDCPRSGEVSLIIDETFGNEVQTWKSFKDFLGYLDDLDE